MSWTTAFALITSSAAVAAIVMGGLIKIFSSDIKKTCKERMEQMDKEICEATAAAEKAEAPIARLEMKVEFLQRQIEEMKKSFETMNGTILQIYKQVQALPKRAGNHFG